MASVVITLIGDDRAGLVDAVAGVVVTHGGNWDRSHLAELAGQFAGIVLVSVADSEVAPLLDALEAIETNGLLAITAQRARPSAQPADRRSVGLELVGQDHPGIVHEISGVLANNGVSIDELQTVVSPAPQGGNLFIADAQLELPASLDVEDLRAALEAVALDLIVDINLVDE